jgi:hypothetical protein
VSPLQSGPKAALRIIPWNQLNGSGVDLLKTAVDFVSPSFGGVFVDFYIQAFK